MFLRLTTFERKKHFHSVPAYASCNTTQSGCVKHAGCFGCLHTIFHFQISMHFVDASLHVTRTCVISKRLWADTKKNKRRWELRSLVSAMKINYDERNRKKAYTHTHTRRKWERDPDNEIEKIINKMKTKRKVEYRATLVHVANVESKIV